MNKSLNIKLESDFRDFYDMHFWRSGLSVENGKPDIVWNRYAENSGLSKRGQFSLMSRMGFDTPAWGLVKDVYSKLRSQRVSKVVIYLDEYAHSGNGKVVMSLEDAYSNFPRSLCCEFIETGSEAGAVSTRRLQIGSLGIELEYRSTSPSEWRSNVDPKISILDATRTPLAIDSDLIQIYPIWAVDFVFCPERKKAFAVDFNESPGMDRTGVDEVVRPQMIYDEIATHLQMLSSGLAGGASPAVFGSVPGAASPAVPLAQPLRQVAS